MLIKDAKTDLAQTKEMKLKIPVGLHIKLHSIKVIHGRQISDTVREAIELWFASNPDFRASPGLELAEVRADEA